MDLAIDLLWRGLSRQLRTSYWLSSCVPLFLAAALLPELPLNVASTTTWFCV